MRKYGIHIILLCCCFFAKAGFSASVTVKVDSLFTSEDLYNTLLQKKASTNEDILLDIQLENASGTEQQLYLSIINPTIDKITIEENGRITLLGDNIRFTQRKFKHINHVYPVLLADKAATFIRLKIHKQWQSLNCRINLSSENAFTKTTNHDNFFIGIFYGILFMFFLLLICFYIFSKSSFFTIYLSINLFMLILFLQYSGTGYQFIWFFSSTIQKYITTVAVVGYLTAHIYFIRTFFSIQFKTNFSGFILKIVSFVLLLFALLSAIQLYNRSSGYQSHLYYLLVNGMFLLYGLMIIALCIYTYLELKRRETLWILIGIIFHIFNWMIFINNEFAMVQPFNYLDNFKLFTSNIFVPQLNYFITMIEVFIITIFISINYHNLLRQNITSEQRLDFLQKRNINTFVLGQEEEREKITQEIESDISKDIEQFRSSMLDFEQKYGDKKMIPVVLKEIDKTLEDIKNITANYMAPDIQQMDLTELIITATDRLFSVTNVQYDFNRLPESFRMQPVPNINIYRILQEISNNIIKHASAANVIITVIKDSESLQIKISDDGVGFSDNISKNKGVGLMNIESRMNSLNGNFYLLSNEKNGSTIHLIMSLKDIT